MTIASASVTLHDLVVVLSDRRTVSVPLSFYPRLAGKPLAALRLIRLSPFGVHWDEFDEDVGLSGMLSLQASVRDEAA